MGDGIVVQIDGLDEANRVACEVYAHVGRLKGAQPDKVASDILKLSLVEARLGGTWRKIYCFADELAAKRLNGKSWLAAAALQHGVRVMVADLDPKQMSELRAAQTRQRMVNDGS